VTGDLHDVADLGLIQSLSHGSPPVGVHILALRPPTLPREEH
jgi:hypothetical protein